MAPIPCLPLPCSTSLTLFCLVPHLPLPHASQAWSALPPCCQSSVHRATLFCVAGSTLYSTFVMAKGWHKLLVPAHRVLWICSLNYAEFSMRHLLDNSTSDGGQFWNVPCCKKHPCVLKACTAKALPPDVVAYTSVIGSISNCCFLLIFLIESTPSLGVGGNHGGTWLVIASAQL